MTDVVLEAYVHRRMILTMAAVLSPLVALVLRDGPRVLGLGGVALLVFGLIRGLDPRPALVIRTESVTFGGWGKLLVLGDRTYAWDEIEMVSALEKTFDNHVGLRRNPKGLDEFYDRHAGPEFVVHTSDGRWAKVSFLAPTPGAAAVREEILLRVSEAAE